MAFSVSAASKPSPGNTIVAPEATQHSTPTTMPKQWYSGTGMHSLSSGDSAIALAQKRALLTMLKCDRVAPFGEPVVPLVNWMLIASSGSSAAVSASSRPRCAGPPSLRSCAYDRQRGGTGWVDPAPPGDPTPLGGGGEAVWGPGSSSRITCFSDGSRTLSSVSLAPLKWT